jgi:hypothetical protein
MLRPPLHEQCARMTSTQGAQNFLGPCVQNRVRILTHLVQRKNRWRRKAHAVTPVPLQGTSQHGSIPVPVSISSSQALLSSLCRKGQVFLPNFRFFSSTGLLTNRNAPPERAKILANAGIQIVPGSLYGS